MKKNILAFLIASSISGFAQTEKTIKIVDAENNIGISYVHVLNRVTKQLLTTSENGQLRIVGSEQDSIEFSIIGYGKNITTFRELTKSKEYQLKRSASYLEEFAVVANKRTNLGVQHVDKINLKLLPINSAQDLLKSVSGLFIAQHAGGGKAEQIFLRGFDNDHGTDFAAFIDDIPINLPSHAHGQGYADLHFIIPELIDDGDYYKGPYEVKNGNFSVSGTARYKTTNGLDKNLVKLEVGDFGFQRGLLALDLTPKNKLFSKDKYEQAYIAVEGLLNDGFFESSQDFEKVSSFFKYNIQLDDKTSITASSSYFNSSWNASGQIPLRAVDDGTIGYFGAIDDTEGGSTSRLSTTLKTTTLLRNNQKISNHGYYFRNKYQLLSNFTFFLNDPINGDMIEQLEDRHVFGYTFEYEREDKVGNTNLRTTVSTGFRLDDLETTLNSSVKRKKIATINNNKIQETNYWAYLKENWNINSKLVIQLGSRIDVFNFSTRNQLESNLSGDRWAYRVSPKLSLFYNPTNNWQLFAKGGAGYHSNYTQTAIIDKDTHPLPRALAADLGTEFKLGKRWLATAAFWVIESDAELVFVADVGGFENNGASLRRGVDFSIKYNVFKNAWFSLSTNYSHGILLDEPDGANSIPSAPRFTSTASFTYKYKNVDLYLGTRYMAERPLTEDEEITADDYFIVDGTINYTYKKIQLGVSLQNIFDQQWVEAVFYDESRLQTESTGVEDLHFTPGTPRFIKGSISYFF